MFKSISLRTTSLLALLLAIAPSFATNPTVNLFKAIKEADMELFEQALAQGADVNAIDPIWGTTPLMECFGNLVPQKQAIYGLNVANGLLTSLYTIGGTFLGGVLLRANYSDKNVEIKNLHNSTVPNLLHIPGYMPYFDRFEPNGGQNQWSVCLRNCLDSDNNPLVKLSDKIAAPSGADKISVDQFIAQQSNQIKAIQKNWFYKWGTGAKFVAAAVGAGLAVGAFTAGLIHLCGYSVRKNNRVFEQMIYTLCDHPDINFEVSDVKLQKNALVFLSEFLHPQRILGQLQELYVIPAWHGSFLIPVSIYENNLKSFFEELARYLYHHKGVSLPLKPVSQSK